MPFLAWWILISVLLFDGYNRNVFYSLEVLAQHVDGGLWFLWVIFVLSIIFPFCNFAVFRGTTICTKVVGIELVGIICGGILIAGAIFTNINMFGIKYILYYAIFYGMGWLIHIIEFWGSCKFTENDKAILAFLCLIIFITICYNYDLYHCGDDILSIVLRFVAGLTGNVVLLKSVGQFQSILEKYKVAWLGKYTLEIYATHMYVNHLFMESNRYSFYTLYGFGNFIASLFCTVVFTTVIIGVIKSIPIANYILYGKKA